MNNKSTCIILLLLTSAAVGLSACGSSTSSNASEGKAGNLAEVTAGQGNTNANLVNTEVANTTSTNIFASFKQDEDYEAIVRPQIVKDGWQPARTKDGDDNCASGIPICKEFPELEAGPSSPRGDAIFRWKKGDKVVNVFTYDNQLFNRYEFETAASAKDPVISGTYTYRYTEDYGGDISFSFGEKGQASFEWNQEDVTWKGSGTWKWDAAKKQITATVSVEPDVETEEVAGKEMQNRQETYVFEMSGKDLRLVVSPNEMSPYKGKTFRKSKAS